MKITNDRNEKWKAEIGNNNMKWYVKEEKKIMRKSNG